MLGAVSLSLLRPAYSAVAGALDSAAATRVSLLTATLSENPRELDVALSFELGLAPQAPAVEFIALAYTLVVADAQAAPVSEGARSVQGIYVGRYSYWGGEVPLTPPSNAFTSPSVMHSLYRERLTAALASGKDHLVALGEATLRVMTRLGSQDVAVPFEWRFTLSAPGGSK